MAYRVSYVGRAIGESCVAGHESWTALRQAKEKGKDDGGEAASCCWFQAFCRLALR